MRFHAHKPVGNDNLMCFTNADTGNEVDPFFVLQLLMTRNATIVKKTVLDVVDDGSTVEGDEQATSERQHVSTYPREVSFEILASDELRVLHRDLTLPFKVLTKMDQEEYEAYITRGVVPDWAQQEVEG